MSNKYDLIIIGSGPAGQNAAFTMSKHNRKVLVIQNRQILGGGSLHHGTIPSKTLREAGLSLSHFDLQYFDKSVKDQVEFTCKDVMSRYASVRTKEMEVIQNKFNRNNIDFVYGLGSFLDQNTIQVLDENGDKSSYKSDYIIIATGSRPNRPKDIPFDNEIIHDSDSILSIKDFPKSLIIAGAGVIGSEYACIFAHMGIKVHLLNRHNEILNFVDKDLRELLTKEMKNDGIIFHSNVELEKIKKTKEGKVSVQLNNGVELEASMLLYCMGRNGNSNKLNLDSIQMKTEKYDLIKVNKNYQTAIKNVYAVGDVVGYPSLASVSAQQGTIAVKDILKLPINSIPELFPYGIYTVPEMSFVGKSETELTEENTPFVTGIADYREVARGQIQGMVKGLLKMHIHSETLKVLGVHIVGYGATEIIHIGQAVLTFGGDVTYFTNNVFNYPTLAEAYKTAAFSAFNKLSKATKAKFQ